MSNSIVEYSAAFDNAAERKEAIESGTHTGTRFMYNTLSLKVQFLLKKNLESIPLITMIMNFTTRFCFVWSGYTRIEIMYKYSLSCIFH